jgi:membrane protein DedA with SNARE-associated domain
MEGRQLRKGNKMHKSDYIIDDIVGGFKIVFISTILIYVLIAVLNALYHNFPIKQDSWWVISLIGGLLILFGKYITNKNKDYFKNE